MAKKTKIGLICALCLILIGGVMFVGGLASMDYDFTQLSTTQYTTRTYEIQESFQNIIIKADLTDVELRPSTDGTCKIVSKSSEEISHSYTVKDNTLLIRELDTRKWHDYIGVFLNSPKITVYLPAKDYEGIAIHTDTGDVNLNQVICSNKITVDTDTGDVTFFECDAGMIGIDTDTGDVMFRDSDADRIQVETDTGDVTGTFLTDKIFYCSSNTGDVHVPRSYSGGRCEIETETGDISIRIKE